MTSTDANPGTDLSRRQPTTHQPHGPDGANPAWTVERSKTLAREHLSGMGNRWQHVQAAGRRAEELRAAGLVHDAVVSAAWLHDIGYAPDLIDTGFHPVDGARYLQRIGVPERIVAMVAWHTGADQEAAERGLQQQLSELPAPDPDDLNTVTLIDLVTSPSGTAVLPEDRIAEILRRYPADHEVHQAVQRSGPGLLDVAARAQRRLGLPDEWPCSHESIPTRGEQDQGTVSTNGSRRNQ